MALHT